MILEIVKNVLGGLGIFLLGMKFMSDGMQALAGPKLATLVGKVTDRRIMAVLVGIGITCLIQSSSATTVMVVGLVNSGIMSLMQAIGVIFGANIGTTLSVWIMTLNVTECGPLIVGVASLIYLFTKKERSRYIGMAVLGIGMLFFGMMLMSDGFKPLRDIPGVQQWFTMFDGRTNSGFIKASLVGALVTGVIQSSHGTVVVVMTLASNGIIPFETAVPLVLGSNIGTTVTALISSVGTSRNALRAALAHTLFNVTGVLVVSLINRSFTRLCMFITMGFAGFAGTSVETTNGFPYPLLGIAFVHTIFNVGSTLMLLPFMRTFERLVTLIVPVHQSEEAPEHFRVRYLDKLLLNQPTVAIQQSKKEILRMGESCMKMLDDIGIVFANEDRDKDTEERIFRMEDDLDIAQKDISEYVGQLLHDTVTHEFAISVRRQLRQADEFESVSDYVRRALKDYIKIRDAGEDLTIEARREVLDLTKKVYDFCSQVMDAVANETANAEEIAHSMKSEIDNRAREYRNAHMQRISVTCTGPVKTLVYSEMLDAFRRINDHLVNIAETIH